MTLIAAQGFLNVNDYRLFNNPSIGLNHISKKQFHTGYLHSPIGTCTVQCSSPYHLTHEDFNLPLGANQDIYNSVALIGLHEYNIREKYRDMLISTITKTFIKNCFPEFAKQWSQSQEYFNIPQSAVLSKYILIKNKIDAMNAKSSSFALTPDGTIHFTIRFDSYKLFLELYFNDEDYSNIEVVLNIYEEKECIKATIGSLNYVFNEIEKYVQKNQIHSYELNSIFMDLFQEEEGGSELSGYSTPTNISQAYNLA